MSSRLFSRLLSFSLSSRLRLPLAAAAALAAAATADTQFKKYNTLLAHQQNTTAASPATADSPSSSSAPSFPDQSSYLLALSQRFGPRLSLDPMDLAAHQYDANSFHQGRAPLAVVYPETIDDVSFICSLSNSYRIPVIPYGSGLSLEGHSLAPVSGVTVDFQRMASIINVYPDDLQVHVQAGITWNNLNDELARYNLFFPVDPGPGSSIGGMVGTNCSGPNAVRYGPMRNNVVNLTVVLADGRVIKTAQRAKKSSAGYDLTRLFVGSEGTLGIVVEATLKVQPIPAFVSVSRCQFPSIRHAAAAAIAIERSGQQLRAIELLDESMMAIVNVYSELKCPEKATLFLKFQGGSRAEVSSSVDHLSSVLAPFALPGTYETSWDKEQNERLWDARKQALWAVMAMDQNKRVWTTDICVPLSRLSECIEATQSDIHTNAPTLVAPIVAHAGDGNFHVLFLIDPSNADEMRTVKALNERMIHRALSMDGTCTGEHGIGMGKREYMEMEYDENTIQTMRDIKHTLDPNGIMNPLKILKPKKIAGTGTATATAIEEGKGRGEEMPKAITTAAGK